MIKKICFCCFLIFCILAVNAQTVRFTNPSREPETTKGTEQVVALEIEVDNTTVSPIQSTLNIALQFETVPIGVQLLSNDFSKITLSRQNISCDIPAGKTEYCPVYIKISRELAISEDVSFEVVATLGAINNKFPVHLRTAKDLNYSITDYLNNSELKIRTITKVESNNNILTIYGYKNGNFLKRNVSLEQAEVLATHQSSVVWRSWHWTPWPISLITVPFKIRPMQQSKDSLFNTLAMSGISNIGFNVSLYKYQLDRYFSTGKKSTHNFSLGFFAAPSVEELDTIYTYAALKKDVKSKQLYISTGITISYAYNGISFVFVPLGWDFGTSTLAKQWIYQGKRWWGFGIAISPSIFATILNK